MTPDDAEFSNSDTTSCSGINQRIINFPYLLVCLAVSASEEGDGHGVAAATVGAGSWHGIYRGLPFEVHGPECVTVDIAFESCYSS